MNLNHQNLKFPFQSKIIIRKLLEDAEIAKMPNFPQIFILTHTLFRLNYKYLIYQLTMQKNLERNFEILCFRSLGEFYEKYIIKDGFASARSD